MTTDRNPELALIVGAARSGTTLLRLLLDAHPEVGCPAEAGIPGLMSHMARVWETIDADIRGDALATDPGQPVPEKQEDPPDTDAQGGDEIQLDDHQAMPEIPELTRDWIRAAMRGAMANYCERGQKRLYVDKSLDSVFNLETVRQVFPGARYVLAFRHVMDTIASGIEASPWGFQAYGYAPYVQSTPGNTVVALARYWLDHVTQALEWEKQHPEACIRVRYEDLVATPDTAIAAVQRFLGVTEHLDVLQRAFEREPARGPGDYKVEHTSGVHAASIGHGKRIPVGMLPPPLLAELSVKLETLGYAALDRSWNAAERAVDVASDGVWSQRLQDLMNQARPPTTHANIGSFALVAEDHIALRWVIDPETSSVIQGDGEVEGVITGTTEDLVLMLTDEENLGVLVRSGRIRHVVAEDEALRGREVYRELHSIVATLRSSVGETGPAPVGSMS